MDVQSLIITLTHMPTMYSATENMQDLKDGLGDQAHLLQYLPLDRLIIAPIHDDPLAISFKIHFGYIRIKRVGSASKTPSPQSDPEVMTRDKQNVWIHLYPAAKPGNRPEIQYHAYDLEGAHVGKHDGENIGKTVSGCMHAFRLPNRRRWAKNKLIAIAKYYFLRKLAEMDMEADREKLKFGIPMTKSFKDELKGVCREFAEDTSSSNTDIARVVTAEQQDKEGSDLSDAPEGLIEEDDLEAANTIAAKVDPVTPNKVVGEPARYLNSNSMEGIVKTLIELQSNEKTVVEDMARIEQKVQALQGIQRARKEEQLQLRKRKEAIFSGLSAEAAYDLGQQVERDSAQKRRRRD